MHKLVKGSALLAASIGLLSFLSEAVMLGGAALGFAFFYFGLLGSFCAGSMLRYGTFFPEDD